MPNRSVGNAGHVMDAARKLSEGGNSFSLELLTVTAWTDNKNKFGITGFEGQYPDINKVCCLIMGVRGLVARGLLAKTAPKQYKLTEAGKQWFADRPVSASITPKLRLVRSPHDSTIKIPLHEQTELTRLILSPSFSHWKEFQWDNISSKEGLAFWMGTDERYQWPYLHDAMQRVRELLTTMRRRLKGAKTVVLSNGQEIGKKEIVQLWECHSLLADKFKKHIKLFNERKA